MVGKLAFLSRLFYPRPPLLASSEVELRLNLHKIPANVRIYAVGDIHGRADLLQQLFARIDANEERQPIKHKIEVFLGDYIDRGPDTRKVLETLTERAKTHELVCLKGNHEALMLRFLDDATVLRVWRHLGGLETLVSYGIVPNLASDPASEVRLASELKSRLDRSHENFLRNLRLSYSFGDFFFAHAGVRPAVPLNQQSEEDLLWIREEFLFCDASFGKIIIHGHSPVLEPDVRLNRINIDTGAYATGRLTCLVLEDARRLFL